MKKRAIPNWLHYTVWALGFIALALLIYGIIRALLI